MAQTRVTIELLTNILEENGVLKVTAEIFRLGKFNHDDAVKPLWKLLFELVYYCEFGKIDYVSVQAYSQLSTQEVAVYVKRGLQTKGFLSKDFAELPNDMTDGSRELLLAFGWLMCKENIITRFVKSCASPLEDMLSGTLPVAPAAVQSGTSANRKGDIYASLQQVLLLNNKLRLSLRSLAAVDREKVLLEHKIHESTYKVTAVGDHRKHLTPMELYMLQKPQLLQSNLALLEQDNQRLQNLLSWRQHEDHFWRWMGSVLDAKIQSQSNTGAVENQVLSESQQMLKHIHHSLMQSVNKYQSILGNLQQQWQLNGDGVTEEELDKVLESLDQELSVHRAQIMLRDCNAYMANSVPETQPITALTGATSLPKAPQFYYDPKRNTQLKSDGTSRSRSDDSSSGAGCSTGDVADIEDEMQSLSNIVRRMEKDLATKQDLLRNELQSLGDKFQNAICIPPMEPKC